jgi:hypothetical protein
VFGSRCATRLCHEHAQSYSVRQDVCLSGLWKLHCSQKDDVVWRFGESFSKKQFFVTNVDPCSSICMYVSVKHIQDGVFLFSFVQLSSK